MAQSSLSLLKAHASYPERGKISIQEGYEHYDKIFSYMSDLEGALISACIMCRPHGTDFNDPLRGIPITIVQVFCEIYQGRDPGWGKVASYLDLGKITFAPESTFSSPKLIINGHPLTRELFDSLQ